MLAGEAVSATARLRFQQEVKTASSLNHPHILTVHDVGELDGRPYLVTEYIDGGTLREWGSTRRRSWHEIVELLVGVAVLKAFPREGGAPLIVCGNCFVKWPRDQRHIFMSMSPGNGTGSGGSMVVPLTEGAAFPTAPAEGIRTEAQLRELPGAQQLVHPGVFPGLSASTFAFGKELVKRNLYELTIRR